MADEDDESGFCHGWFRSRVDGDVWTIGVLEELAGEKMLGDLIGVSYSGGMKGTLY